MTIPHDVIGITDDEIQKLEQILLPKTCKFDDDARAFIKCWESKEVNACPGSGKTTVLLAKLKILADRMPLECRRGICVLSHTNVAVNEIKSKLAKESNLILDYPNFVGTLQAFVDHFIVLPYIRRLCRSRVCLRDNRSYAHFLYKLLLSSNDYSCAMATIRCRYDWYKSRYNDIVAFLADLHLRRNGLYSPDNKLIAGKSSRTFIEFKKAVNVLLIEYGVLKFEDAFCYATGILDKFGDIYSDLLSRRFKYVFVDEYQDCSLEQRTVIDRIFNHDKSIVFKIGDVDQSIFNGRDEAELWNVSENVLPLKFSNRYGQEVADLLSCLRLNCEKIVSSRGILGQKPVLIVFDENNPKQVLPEFLQILNDKKICNRQGVYKVIGKVKNLKGLTIGDYWDGYNFDKTTKENTYWTYLSRIRNAISSGELFEIERAFKDLLSDILRLCSFKEENIKHDSQAIKLYLQEQDQQDAYRTQIIELAKLDVHNEDLDAKIRHSIVRLVQPLGKDFFNLLPEYFLEKNTSQSRLMSTNNIYVDSIGRQIVFDTVHRVKGETHDVTLYVETEESRGSDLGRVCPLFEGKKLKASKINDYARRCVYVGMSRPRILLCVAIMRKTFEKHKNAFYAWELHEILK